jgi:cell shape-determining protein MreC
MKTLKMSSFPKIETLENEVRQLRHENDRLREAYEKEQDHSYKLLTDVHKTN